MIICILAGGEGSRLWPISTPDNPKQIIKLNNSNSLIQNTYSLLKKVSKSIYIVSEESHYKKILKSIDGLSKKNMIVEPCRRGTTNCLLLAAKYISEQLKGKSDGERILFIHADHIFDNQKEFVKSINQLKKIKDKSTIVIGGRKPTYPGTKYGYVETKKGENGLYKVVKFVEKPDQKTADLLFSKPNYFWNEGFVSTSITSLVQSFQKYNPAVHENWIELEATSFLKIKNVYKKLPSSSIEKSLLEKADNVLLLPISFGWTDLGTYNSLCDSFDKNNNYNGGQNIFELDNTKTFIYNATNIKIAALGLKNLVVALTPDGLLVMDKEKEELVPEILKQITKKDNEK